MRFTEENSFLNNHYSISLNWASFSLGNRLRVVCSGWIGLFGFDGVQNLKSFKAEFGLMWVWMQTIIF